MVLIPHPSFPPPFFFLYMYTLHLLLPDDKSKSKSKSKSKNKHKHTSSIRVNIKRKSRCNSTLTVYNVRYLTLLYSTLLERLLRREKKNRTPFLPSIKENYLKTWKKEVD